jgi:hypothetical protein
MDNENIIKNNSISLFCVKKNNIDNVDKVENDNDPSIPSK